MGKVKHKCMAVGQGTWLDGRCEICKTRSTKCPYRNKYRDLRHTKKGDSLYKRGDIDGEAAECV